jgi:hypothetical protein
VADDFEIRGADQFLALSKALKHAGRTELRKELNKGIKRAAKPLIPKARAEALRRLPQSGGLAKQVAKEPARVQVRTGARTAGVRVVVGRRRGGARQANRGVIRHPVFGNRDVWVNQRVPSGWFDDPMKDAAPAIRRDVEQALEDVAEQIVREAGG